MGKYIAIILSIDFKIFKIFIMFEHGIFFAARLRVKAESFISN